MEEAESDTLRRARELAMTRLSVREYSAQEMLTYLKRKAIPKNLAAETILKLQSEQLLDDQRFARALTRSQIIRNKGPAYIHSRLRQKGVKIELTEVKTIFSETSERTELELARQIVEKRYPNAKIDRKILKRAYGALLRRGFSSETARKVLWGKTEALLPEDD